jgi:hypothetical protein
MRKSDVQPFRGAREGSQIAVPPDLVGIDQEFIGGFTPGFCLCSSGGESCASSFPPKEAGMNQKVQRMALSITTSRRIIDKWFRIDKGSRTAVETVMA